MTVRQFAAAFLLLLPVLSFSNLGSASTDKEAMEIEVHGRRIGTIESIKFKKHENQSRISILVDATFESFPEHLDDILGSKRNLLRRCTKRLYWRGDTSMRHGGEVLKMTSRLAYELWVCPGIGQLRFKHLSDSRRVDWTLSIRPGPIEDISLSAHLDNIVGVANWLEDLLDVNVTEDIKIDVPKFCGKCECSELANRLQPMFEGARFDIADSTTLDVSAVFSAKNDIAGVLQCLGNFTGN